MWKLKKLNSESESRTAVARGWGEWRTRDVGPTFCPKMNNSGDQMYCMETAVNNSIFYPQNLLSESQVFSPHTRKDNYVR